MVQGYNVNKAKFIEKVLDEVKGKSLSDTDIRVTFCDMIDNAYRSEQITGRQALNWYLTEREQNKLRKATRCSC